jgi:hypothetical protein
MPAALPCCPLPACCLATLPALLPLCCDSCHSLCCPCYLLTFNLAPSLLACSILCSCCLLPCYSVLLGFSITPGCAPRHVPRPNRPVIPPPCCLAAPPAPYWSAHQQRDLTLNRRCRCCLAGCLADPCPLLPCCPSCHGSSGVCCRDFMNAALPWGDPDWNYISALLPVGPEGASNVLSVSFDSMTYPVTVDGIHTVRACCAPCCAPCCAHAVVGWRAVAAQGSDLLALDVQRPRRGNAASFCERFLLVDWNCARLLRAVARPTHRPSLPPAMPSWCRPADLLNLRHSAEGAHL